MKIINLIKIAVLLFVLFLVVIYLYLFFAKFNFVKSIDGNEKNKMIKIKGDYYYSNIDSAIWIFERKFSTYKRVTNNKVDSLNWDDKIIIGHSKSAYFMINLDSKSINYYENKTDILNVKYIISKNKLENLPALTPSR